MIDAIDFHVFEQWLSLHPEYGLWATFLISFIESLAIIGSVVPGSVTMTIIGTMIGSTLLPLYPAVMAAFTGAMVGDILSFYVGYVYQEKVRALKWMQNHQAWWSKSEAFIVKHGFMSVIIGRFFGPMRSMIPMIAGLLKMRPIHFVFAAIPAASLWVLVYLTPGLLLGMFSLEMPPGKVLHWLGHACIALIGALLFGWCIHRLKPTVKTHLHHGCQKLSAKILQHWPTASQPDVLTQRLQSTGMACWYGLLFLLLGNGVSKRHMFDDLNLTIYHFFQNLHVPVFNAIMLSTTFMADKYVLSCVVIALAAMLALNIHLKEGLRLLIATTFSVLMIKFFKTQYHIARPPHMLHILGHTSFPSGHTGYITFLVGYLYLSFQDSWSQRLKNHLYVAGILLVTYIMITRLYLGAHWLTDVVGAGCLGLALSYLTTAWLKKQPCVHQSDPQTTHKHRILQPMVILPFMVWLIATSCFLYRHYTRYTKNFFGMPPTQSVSKAHWLKHPTVMPTIRNNRFGHAQEVFNIQWAQSTKLIHQQLKTHGWHIQALPKTFPKRLMFALQNPAMRFMPTLPKLHQTRPPFLVAYHKDGAQVAVLRLWLSRFDLYPSHTPIFLGTLYSTHQNGDKLHKSYAPRNYAHTLAALPTSVSSYKQQHPLHWAPLKRAHWPLMRSVQLSQIYS